MSTKNNKEIGALGESVACEFLTKMGFKVLERNYWKPWGEIDIIAQKEKRIHFIEVKSVSREMPDKDDLGAYRPEEQVHPKKLKRLSRTIMTYLDSKKLGEVDFQLDVVAVFLNMQTRKAQCRYLENVL